MSEIPDWVNRLPLVKGWNAAAQARLVEIVRFCLVGGANWVVDLMVFNLLLFTFFSSQVLIAKTIAGIVAATFSWLVNRNWTFETRATTRPFKELVTFWLVNLAGLLPPLLCLWISHYVLGLTSVLADNISANLIGLILGTILRYFGYRQLVFTR